MQLKNFKKILSKAVPLWMVLLIVLNSTLAMGIIQYYLLRQELKKNIQELAKTTKSPEELIQILKQQVLPQDGYKTSLKWKDLGKRLVEAGAIEKGKFEASVTSDADGKDHMKYMDGDSEDNIGISEKNAHFVVNFFWALGLVNKSKVLDEGPMKTGNTPTANFASTAGWTLGTKPAMELYSSQAIIPLTAEQQELVKKIAENVSRPCYGNSTAFPDCNHGMAALGYIEMAVYFDKQGTKWGNIDPKVALSADYSSAQGAQKVKQAVQSVPGVTSQGGGCGV